MTIKLSPIVDIKHEKPSLVLSGNRNIDVWRHKNIFSQSASCGVIW